MKNLTIILLAIVLVIACKKNEDTNNINNNNNNIPNAYAKYNLTAKLGGVYKFNAADANSTFLRTLSEAGLVGVLFLLGVGANTGLFFMQPLGRRKKNTGNFQIFCLHFCRFFTNAGRYYLCVPANTCYTIIRSLLCFECIL